MNSFITIKIKFQCKSIFILFSSLLSFCQPPSFYSKLVFIQYLYESNGSIFRVRIFEYFFEPLFSLFHLKIKSHEVGYTVDDVQLMQNNGKLDTQIPGIEIQHVSAFRRILPQVLASFVKHLLILDLAIAMTFPTVIIPQLTGVKNRAPDETLTFTDLQASWFGACVF